MEEEKNNFTPVNQPTCLMDVNPDKPDKCANRTRRDGAELALNNLGTQSIQHSNTQSLCEQDKISNTHAAVHHATTKTNNSRKLTLVPAT